MRALVLLKRAEESRQVVLGPLTVRVASEKCCWCTVRATMGCVPAKRVQSSVADERSSAVHSTGSIPTTPILSASEDKTSPEGVRRSPERFVVSDIELEIYEWVCFKCVCTQCLDEP